MVEDDVVQGRAATKTSTENSGDYQHRDTSGRYRHGCAACDVHASGLNRADLIVASRQRHGEVGGVSARIGLECAEIKAVGSEALGRGCQSAASEA